MTQSWHFFAVRAARPSGFTWQWQKQGARLFVTSGPFDFYFDCVSDARDKGYAGPLPAGPRVPLDHLPTAPVRPNRVLAAVPAEFRSGPGVMTPTPISAADVRKRRARDASAVS